MIPAGTLLLLGAALHGQPLALSTRGGLDPSLPEALRPVVQAAAEAEVDPKRGPGNAQATLQSALQSYTTSQPEHLALRLRIAATYLRNSFLTTSKKAAPERYVEALSTFGRLDLTEPGLQHWIEQCLAHKPDARAAFKTARKIPVSVLIRGAGLRREAVRQAFEAAFKPTGFSIDWVPAREAHFVLKLAARMNSADRTVRVELETEGVHSGEVAWRDGAFRVSRAADLKAAVQDSLQWLARVSGRNLLFRWMGEHGLPGLLSNRGAHHDHHHHHGHPGAPTRPQGASPPAPDAKPHAPGPGR